MIKCEGFKAFKGSAIVFKGKKFEEKKTGDWLYKPEYDCWYCNGSSYPASTVSDIEEEIGVEREQLKKEIAAIKQLVLTGANSAEIMQMCNKVEERWGIR